MLDYLSQNPIPNEAFVLHRIGGEARFIIESQRIARTRGNAKTSHDHSSCWSPSRILKSFYWWILRSLLGETRYRALEIGLFRGSGEIHHWMYDEHSLSLLLNQAGFSHLAKFDAFTSSIEDWKRFCLDTQPDGSVYKPDSLYMEAVKLSQ
jgi:hypothetical protein